jgi:diguanylate cyclase (GGDEF)-like protein
MLRTGLTLGASAVMVSIIGWIDYLTGSEMAFSVFYFAPVAIAAWYGGRLSGTALACFSACIWLAADLSVDTRYSEQWIPFWNASIRFLTFLIMAVLVSHMRMLLVREKYLAETDALTGCLNRRSFIDQLDGELRRLRRYRLPLSLAFIDIDNFKLVNDTLGHQAGDEVLRLIAETLRSRLRSTDIVGRIGGDEFVILLPLTEEKQSEVAIQDLLDELADVAKNQVWPISYSVGVVFVDVPCDSSSSLLGEADRLMYEVKNGGKNRMLQRTLSELSILSATGGRLQDQA